MNILLPPPPFDSDVCMRAKPEYKGTSNYELYVILVAFGFCLSICACAVCSTVLCGVFRKTLSREVQQLDDRYYELEGQEDDSERLLLGQTSEGNGQQETHTGWKFLPTVTVLHTPCCVRLSHRICRYMCGCLTLVAVVLTVVFVALQPQAPEFSACTSSFEWSTMFTHMSLVEDLVISVYNPNRLDLETDHIDGTIYYEGEEVIAFHYDAPDKNHTFKVPSGTVSDIVIKAHLSCSPTTVASMVAQYEMSTLVLSVDANIHVSITHSLWKLYETTYHLPKYSFATSDISPGYCKDCSADGS